MTLSPGLMRSPDVTTYRLQQWCFVAICSVFFIIYGVSRHNFYPFLLSFPKYRVGMYETYLRNLRRLITDGNAVVIDVQNEWVKMTQTPLNIQDKFAGESAGEN